MKYHLGWKGLTHLAGQANGIEKLGVGIRPYGLHAGNLASVVAYPYLFCEKFEALRGEHAHFTFQVWLNDIEPVKYVGADGRPESADWANMYPAPGTTSFHLTPAPNGFKGNLVDYWQPAIEGMVRGTIGARFPHVNLEFRRASELVNTREFKKTVIGCMEKSDRVKERINRWNRFVAHVQGPASFVWPLCPECHAPLMEPKLKRVMGRDLISAVHESMQHRDINKKSVGDLSWAVQFRMLHAARLAAIKPDLWFMGMDHVPTSMGDLMEDLAKTFGIDEYEGKFLHAPLLFAGRNKKLSKSLGNAVYMSLDDLIDALRDNPNSGLNVKNAPISSDILSIGPDLLPSHIAGNNQEQRMAVLQAEKEGYKNSLKRKAFRSNNAEGKITEHRVARMLGVPHLG